MISAFKRSPRRPPGVIVAVLFAFVPLGVALAAPPDDAPVARRQVRRHLQRAIATASGPSIAGCPIFPANNVWNARADLLPVDPHSADYIASIGPSTGLHPDFGSGTWDGGPIGIPYAVVPGSQPPVPVSFDYGDESDPGPYPIPPDAPIEGGPQSDGDRHVLLVDGGHCRLYELYAAYPQQDGSWRAGSGAIFDLGSNALRPAGWTSADAAGLPIFPGLVRYDEVVGRKAINHALRFTPTAVPEAGGGFFSKLAPAPDLGGTQKESDAPAALNNPRVWIVRNGSPSPIPLVLGATDGKFTQVKSGNVTPGMELIIETLKEAK